MTRLLLAILFLCALLCAQSSELKTTWTDKEGVTHTVTTPIPNPDEIASAMEFHADVVERMKLIWPPKKGSAMLYQLDGDSVWAAA